MRKKIVIFGGAFDPLHQAHIYIAKRAVQVIKAQKLYFVPTAKAFFKSPIKASNQARLAMLRVALKALPQMAVSNFDIKAQNGFSFNTVQHFKQRFPNAELYFLIGSDKLSELAKWHNIEQLQKLCRFVCYERFGYPIDEQLVQQFNVRLLGKCPLDLASSEMFGSHKFRQIPAKVLHYIHQHNIYLKTILQTLLDEPRMQHCLRVGQLAKTLAVANKLDGKTAYTAGAYHDLAKQLPQAQLEKLAKVAGVNDYPSWKVLHSYVGAYILKHWYGLNNSAVFSAIWNHTVPPQKMSQLDMIIYLADKLEPMRVHEEWAKGIDITALVKLAKKDLKLAYQITLKYVRSLQKN
ncbi:nicotinate-nucleotide adenylyltransferase [Mycoplasmoides pneumoniae]|uniref:nicotinate-nucleotide adenylyltransferase n=1 Tax=Mycoplasmoides pneumoniae TaxID=2104 RepID=UPI0006BA34D2|nr:nicotinate-nucleotide adenylyltransferase [Mycoplasmoides pneumoniae]